MEEKIYRIKINLQSGEIEVEGDKEFVKTEIERLLDKLQKRHIKYPLARETAEIGKVEEGKFEGKKPYIKEFIKEKKPNGALQTSVVLAYYLTKYERKETFTKEDMKKMWTVSGRKPPKKIWQAVVDGKNRYGWYEEVSRGEYKISPHGIYFVEHEIPKKNKK